MSSYSATIEWQRGDAVFTDNRYSRAHLWRFDGLVVPGSSSPSVVPLPMSRADAVDPEEAFVASLSSCHMLWFLSIAADAGWVVDAYLDEAVGTLARNADRKVVMTEVRLRPQVRFGGDRQPAEAEPVQLHHRAHEECFIANSVKTVVLCEPQHLK